MDRYAIVEINKAPVIEVRVVGDPNEQNYAQYLEDLGDAFRTQDRFAMIFDTQDLAMLPAKFRAMQTDWLEKTREEFEGRWLSSAFVIQSMAIRGVLTALFWISRPYYENTTVATSEAAWQFTDAILSKQKVEIASE